MKESVGLYCKAIILYIFMMIFGMFISEKFFVIDRTTTFWLFNMAGFFLYVCCLWKLDIRFSMSDWLFMFSYLASCAICLLFHGDHLFSDVKSLGLNVNVIVVGLNFLLLYGKGREIRLSEYDVRVIMRTIFYIGVFASVYALLFQGVDWKTIFETNNIYDISARSFFDHKNTFGAFTVFTVFAGMYELYYTRLPGVTICLLALQCLCLLISFSRAALLCFGVFIVVYLGICLFLRCDKREPKNEVKTNTIFFKIVIAVMAAVLLLFLISSDIRHMIINGVFRADFRDAGRSEIWRKVLSVVFADTLNLFFGIGYSDLNANNLSYVHNIYLEIFAVGGIVKILFYFFVIMGEFLNLKKKYTTSVVHRMGLCVLIAYLVYGFFESQVIFELGILPYLFLLFISVLPRGVDDDPRTLLRELKE